jgi:polar amino acid transport system permease protein
MGAFFSDWGPTFAHGVEITLIVTVLGSVLALVVAFILGFLARARPVLPRFVARVIIEFFRGTSLFVQLFWLFYVLPLFGYQLNPIAVGVVATGLNYGAYAAEVVRGAINAIPKPQFEATVALNMTPYQRMRRVILPQAFVGMIPPLGNLLIQALKGSALVSLITLTDITTAAQRYRESGGSTFVAFGFALLIYFVIAYGFTLGLNAVEHRAKAGVGMVEPRRALFAARKPPPVQGSELA